MKLATVPHAVFSRSDSFDLGAVLNQVGEAVAYVDAHWVVRFCNDTYLADLGMAREDVLGRTPFEYIDGFERSIFYEAFEHCRVDLQPKTRIAFSVVLNRWLMVRVFPLAGGMLMLANDATESVVKQYQLAQQVLKDPLTGVANKLAMERDVVELVAAGTPFCFAVFGLERFAEVNETYGYSTGDMVLMEVASSLQSATQSAEALYRVSGNEFAVLRSGSQYGGAERAAALMEAVRKPITFGGARIVLGACAGTVASPARLSRTS
jgi:diguanylate cyclase (GGDEF)-like protein